MSQLLTTARSWQACGHEPYQLPPEHLWGQIVPTLHLYQDLKSRGILPANTQIRSVYRNPELNQCAGGAAMSKHLTNSAIDIWVPDLEIKSQALYELQNRLCQYWLEHGETKILGWVYTPQVRFIWIPKGLENGVLNFLKQTLFVVMSYQKISYNYWLILSGISYVANTPYSKSSYLNETWYHHMGIKIC